LGNRAAEKSMEPAAIHRMEFDHDNSLDIPH
jgi:hypothetical protein